MCPTPTGRIHTRVAIWCLGPLIVGAISDGLSGSLGTESLRYAMLMAPVAVLVGWSLALLAWRRLESAPQSAA